MDKLKWLRAGCASIAEFEGKTFIIEKRPSRRFALFVREASGQVKESLGEHDSIEIAEKQGNKWVDELDKPVWIDSGFWHTQWRDHWAAILPGEVCWSIFIGRGIVRTNYLPVDCPANGKVQAEKIIREQTCGK